MFGKRLLMDVSPLKESPPFRRLWIGSTVSTFGSMMTGFAVMLQVYRLTNSSLDVGLIGIAEAIPAVIFGFLGGAVADRIERRNLVMVTSFLLAVVSSLLATQAYANLGEVWVLYCLVAVQALVNAVDGPARRTFLPRLLPEERIPAGAALNLLGIHSSVILGPIVAGILTATLGLKVCYLIDAISFAAAIYSVFRLPSVPVKEQGDKATLHAMWEGMRFISKNGALGGALLADLNATILGFPFAVFPAINAERFGGSSTTLGLLMAAVAVGGVVGSGLSGPVGKIVRQGRAILIGTCVWGVAVIAFGLAHTLWLAILLLIIAGVADVISVVLRTTLVQVVTPDEYRGRVSAAEYMTGTALPELGYFRSGALGSIFSPTTSVISGGGLVIAGAGLIGLLLPSFRRYASQPKPASEEAAKSVAT
ncbi:MAG: MFS transporter [Streptosporangiaceae bacterium]